jgi:predicted signal transduction protein with EAL and GGDEF domain
MTTVAEGVETEEQMARIVSDGCTDVQGNLISRPLPAKQVGSFLLSRNEIVFRDQADKFASPDHASALSTIRPLPVQR